ncbi:hypothetical protein IHE44_0008247 [Lamprotornis superbus]|uniref:Uncharacterized protein n=1 Tax=Lamprotornis superbus TaxID=245042 RepID=A0A835NEC0_9PASS|nr:hypothetical protein IHE44_0008247 [Lamprotornis superbus]
MACLASPFLGQGRAFPPTAPLQGQLSTPGWASPLDPCLDPSENTEAFSAQPQPVQQLGLCWSQHPQFANKAQTTVVLLPPHPRGCSGPWFKGKVMSILLLIEYSLEVANGKGFCKDLDKDYFRIAVDHSSLTHTPDFFTFWAFPGKH